MYGISLGLGEVLAFWVYGILMGLAEPGIPQGAGGARFFPLFVAVGIPLEGAVLIEAVKTIPDVFMTLVNVTGDMSVATLLGRKTESDLAPPLSHSKVD